eukprot:4221621-Alexandrium_andersonii.AAC.1
MVVATINLSGMMKPVMHHQLETYMKEKQIQLMALSETKSPGTTKYVVGDVLYLMSSGLEPGDREHAGVGFAITKEARAR